MARAWWYSILIPIFLLNSKKEAAWVSLRPISPAPSTRSQDSWLPFRRSHLSPAVLIRPTSQLKLHRWNPPLRWISLHPPLSNPPLEQKSNPPINLLLCPCHRPRQWHPPPPHSNLDLPNRYEDLFFFYWQLTYLCLLPLSLISLSISKLQFSGKSDFQCWVETDWKSTTRDSAGQSENSDCLCHHWPRGWQRICWLW